MWFFLVKIVESTLFQNFAQEFHELQEQQLHQAAVKLVLYSLFWMMYSHLMTKRSVTPVDQHTIQCL
jgi:hypothetical protein